MTRKTGKAPVINGILNVDKPKGATSMDVVRRIKRASRQKRVGHGGTLDPIATGVIPICMGQATRMMEYVVDGAKEYRGTVELGVETDTYDAMGEAVPRGGHLRGDGGPDRGRARIVRGRGDAGAADVQRPQDEG